MAVIAAEAAIQETQAEDQAFPIIVTPEKAGVYAGSAVRSSWGKSKGNGQPP